MGFDENAFMIAGTAIAMFGVGLYIWDTRKDSIKSAAAKGYSHIQSTGYSPSGYSQVQMSNQSNIGGSRRRRKRTNKTKRNK